MKKIKSKKMLILLSLAIVISILIIYSIINSNKLKINKNTASQISYEKYNNGLLSMQIPKGWKVEISDGKIAQYVYYTFTVYNPENTNYRIFFNLKTEGYPASEEHKNTLKSFGIIKPFTLLPVITPKNVETFYSKFNEVMDYYVGNSINIPQIKEFTTIETIGNNITGGDILRATYKDESNNSVDGIFTATIEDNIYNGIVTIAIFNTIFMTTPENELTNWESVLNYCISTIKFSDEFIINHKEAKSKIKSGVLMNEDKYENILDYAATSKIINKSWESRKSSYDIENQKKLDDSLGYERVYSTKNAKIYKVKKGFIKKQNNAKKYRPITDDMYNLPTTGIIEK